MTFSEEIIANYKNIDIQEAMRVVCESGSNKKAVVEALETISYFAQPPRGALFGQAVEPTEEFEKKLIALLHGDCSPGVYSAAAKCAYRLWLCEKFDNHRLDEKTIRFATTNICDKNPLLKEGAEILLGILPLSAKISPYLARHFYSRFRRQLRTMDVEESESQIRAIRYFRILLLCGLFREEKNLFYRFKALVRAMNNCFLSLEEETAYLRKTHQELSGVLKPIHTETPVAAIEKAGEFPGRLSTAVLSCRGAMLFADYTSSFELGEMEAVQLLSLAARKRMGMNNDDGISDLHITVLFDQCKLMPTVGAFVIVPFFRELCVRGLADAALRCYQQFYTILDRPWRFVPGAGKQFTVEALYDHLCTKSRLEMCILEALRNGKTEVAQIFKVYLDKKPLYVDTRESISKMLLDHLAREPLDDAVMQELLDFKDNTAWLPSNSLRLLERFYDDRGVAEYAAIHHPHDGILPYICDLCGYGNDLEFAMTVIPENPLVFSHLSQSLQNNPQCIALMNHGNPE